MSTTITRTTLFSSRDGTEAFDELQRLESLYLATVRRKLGISLFFSCGAHNVYSITAYSESGQEEELEWLRANVKGEQP